MEIKRAHLVADSGNLDLGDRIADFSIDHRLPFFTSSPRVVEFGALLAYGASLGKLFIRSGYFIKRILDGANPGVDRINLRTSHRGEYRI
jgi:putative ABC transport system substrate-binding protein